MLGLIGWSALFPVFLKLMFDYPIDEHRSISWEYKSPTYHSFRLNAFEAHLLFKWRSYCILNCQNWILAAILLFANQSINQNVRSFSPKSVLTSTFAVCLELSVSNQIFRFFSDVQNSIMELKFGVYQKVVNHSKYFKDINFTNSSNLAETPCDLPASLWPCFYAFSRTIPRLVNLIRNLYRICWNKCSPRDECPPKTGIFQRGKYTKLMSFGIF